MGLKTWLDRSSTERPLADVPAGMRLALTAALAAQVVLSALQPPPAARAQALPPPPGIDALRLASLGDPVVLAQLLTLYLQAYDNQAGISIPFADLDYQRVEAWLARILQLDPRGQYPLLLASQVYSQVPDPQRQRRMLDLVYRSFQEDPARRWRWLAHAVIMAKHRLKDNELALRYARALREGTQPGEAPAWARQLEIFIYEDMGQYEAARILLGGLLDSGVVTDPHELQFLTQRLQALENAEKSTPASRSRLPAAGPAITPPADPSSKRNQ